MVEWKVNKRQERKSSVSTAQRRWFAERDEIKVVWCPRCPIVDVLHKFGSHSYRCLFVCGNLDWFFRTFFFIRVSNCHQIELRCTVPSVSLINESITCATKWLLTAVQWILFRSFSIAVHVFSKARSILLAISLLWVNKMESKSGERTHGNGRSRAHVLRITWH